MLMKTELAVASFFEVINQVKKKNGCTNEEKSDREREREIERNAMFRRENKVER